MGMDYSDKNTEISERGKINIAQIFLYVNNFLKLGEIMPQSNKEIANSIRRIAKEKGVTVKQTLDDCGINRNFLYDLEKGNSSPSVDKLSRIAEYFGVGISKLIDGEDGDVAAFLSLYKKLSPDAKTALRDYMAGLIEG